MKKTLLILSGIIAITASLRAQQITGVVKDQTGKGMEKTTVSLLNAKDSALVKLGVSRDNGQYTFTQVQEGSYLIEVSYVGFLKGYSDKFEVSGSGHKKIPDIELVKVSAELSAIVVTSQKPMVEVKADKTILNVEGTINATGNDALELLRKSPGVQIDKDDNISLAGKNGVQIYIDGKPSPLAGADLAAYLRALQSSQIESIEIITNPSAKYDAAGNAGIINIKLKKNKAFGTNGSLTAGYNIGEKSRYNSGLALNNRNQNINVFGNYNFNRSANTNDFNLYRELLDSIFDQESLMINKSRSHGFKGGMDYFISKKSTLGFLINGSYSENRFNSDSRTYIQYKPSGVTDRLLVANNRNNAERNAINYNLNYRYADTAGRELNLDADYGRFRIGTNQLQPNYYYDASGTNLLSQAIYRFISPTDIDIYTVKGDYEENFKKGRLGAGFKLAWISTENNFGRYNVQQLHPEAKQLDVARSNQFNYSENINAAYINYNKQIKSVMFQAGLRIENTITTGDSYALNPDGSVNTGSKQSFKRKYTDVFPSVAVSFNKNPENQWGISYSRRIDRPAYQDLNPFEFKLDEYTFMKGNTDLRPQYTNIISLTNTYKYRLTTRLSYSHVADVFTQLVDTAEKSKSFLTRKNLATQNVVNLNVSYPFQYKTYSLFASFSGNYSHYKADFGGGNRVVNLDLISVNVFMQHSLKLGKKGWTAEVSGWYNSPSIWGGTFKSKALWSADAGVQKTLFNGKANLKVSVSDIFHTIQWRGTSRFAGQTTIASGHSDSRQLRTSFTWRFGSNQVKSARQRKLGLEEESKRTQSSGGIVQ